MENPITTVKESDCTYNLYMLTMLAIKTVTGEAHIGGDCVYLVYNLRRVIRL